MIIDLRDRSNSGSGISGNRFLPDRNGWTDALNLADLWFPNPVQELTCVGRERLNVAPLALRVEGVKSERGFSRPADTGDDCQPVDRHLDVDVLEIVLLGPQDADGVIDWGVSDHRNLRVYHGVGLQVAFYSSQGAAFLEEIN